MWRKMDQPALMELIFSTAPKLTALLLAVFVYALQRYDGVKGTNLARGYKVLVLCVFGAIVLSAFCALFSFLALTIDVLKEIMFYLTVSLFWSTLILLMIACTFIVISQIIR
jgi:glycosyltransferase A (GT-A) superfamily protein (DUF2064 family)